MPVDSRGQPFNRPKSARSSHRTTSAYRRHSPITGCRSTTESRAASSKLDVGSLGHLSPLVLFSVLEGGPPLRRTASRHNVNLTTSRSTTSSRAVGR
jgi:hypothetical protein